MKIIIADHHKIIRDCLKALLEKQLGMQVMAEISDGREIIKLAIEMQPDVIIMDIAMPGLNGIEAARHISMVQPNIKIIALSMHSHRQLIAGMFKAGAAGYLLKDCIFEELINAIDVVARKQVYISPGIARLILNEFINHEDDEPDDTLTVREREVLQLLADGKKNFEIARILYISEKTVETHRRKIMKKLAIDTIAELTKYAIRHGLTTF